MCIIDSSYSPFCEAIVIFAEKIFLRFDFIKPLKMCIRDRDNDDETDTEKIWDYTLENDGITLSRYLSADTHIITPAQIKGKSVRRIGAYLSLLQISVTVNTSRSYSLA